MRIWNGGHFENYRKLLSFKMSQNYLYGVPLNSKTILKFWFTYKFHLQVEISRKMWNRNFYGGHLVLCKLGVFSPIILMGTSRFWKRRFIRSFWYHFGSALGGAKSGYVCPTHSPGGPSTNGDGWITVSQYTKSYILNWSSRNMFLCVIV